MFAFAENDMRVFNYSFSRVVQTIFLCLYNFYPSQQSYQMAIVVAYPFHVPMVVTYPNILTKNRWPLAQKLLKIVRIISLVM